MAALMLPTKEHALLFLLAGLPEWWDKRVGLGELNDAWLNDSISRLSLARGQRRCARMGLTSEAACRVHGTEVSQLSRR
jgi:hypothetical protein